MNRLFIWADEYLKESDWKTLTMIKFCLTSIGVMIGVNVDKKYRKPVFFTALGVFLSTYLPLMAKLFTIAVRKRD